MREGKRHFPEVGLVHELTPQTAGHTVLIDRQRRARHQSELRAQGRAVRAQRADAQFPIRGVEQTTAHEVDSQAILEALRDDVEDAGRVLACVDGAGRGIQQRQLFELGAQFLFRPLGGVDVGVGPVPADDPPLGISQRQTVGFEPAVAAVASSKSGFDIVGPSDRTRALPFRDEALAIIRVDDLDPAESEIVPQLSAGILHPLWTHVVTGAVGLQRPNEVRQCPDQGLQAQLTCPQLGLGPLRCGDVAEERAESRTLRLGDRDDRKLNWKFVAVAVQGLQLNAPIEHHRVAGRQIAFQPGGVSGAVPLGNDELCKGPPLGLGLAPSKGELRLRVPVDDASLAVDADDGIQRVLDDQSRATLCFLAGPLLPLPAQIGSFQEHRVGPDDGAKHHDARQGI